jgi:Terminase small subunit
MPALQNPRHEKFARLWHRTGNSSRSYRIAFGHSEPEGWHRRSGHKLLTKADVRIRIAELQRNTTRRGDITIERTLTEYEEARLLARAQEQPGAMLAATEKKARLCGLIVDKRQTVASCAGFEDAKSLPELFDQIANQFGHAAAVGLMEAINSIIELVDLEIMETEGNA